MSKILILKLIFITIAMAAIFNLFIHGIVIPELGDGKLIALILSNRELFPAVKYLAGIETLRMGYAAIWQFPPITKIMPGEILDQANFIRVAGITVMAFTSLYLLHIYPKKYSLLLAISTPVWMLFSFGYLEYYPFIAGAYLALLCWIFNGKLEDKSSLWIGITTGALPLLYTGFAPLSLIILLVYLWGTSFQIVMRTFGGLLLGFFITLRLFWPKSLSEYFVTLYQELNFGEANTIYEGYRGMAASETSIFFKNDYAWSAQHISELIYMLSHGLGLAPLALLLVSPFFCRQQINHLSKKKILAALILCWSLFYFIYTIPKLGPRLDIDMFFMTYIAIAFFAGAALDANKNIKSNIKQNIIIPVYLISSTISLWLLININ